MPFGMFDDDIEEEKEALAEQRDLLGRLGKVSNNLALFRDNPLWAYLQEYLLAAERRDFEILIGAPIEEVNNARARIMVIRDLVSLPQKLEQEQARLSEESEEEE